MLRKILFFALMFISGVLSAQRVIPFEDFNNYFRTFENGTFRQLEFQRIKEFKAGDEFVAYIDNRGNLRVYNGVERQDISNMNVNYEVSDHLMAYSIGPTLNLWDEGKLRTLTYFAQDFAVRDSIVVFEDTRFKTVCVYYNKEIKQFLQLTGDVSMPQAIGDNIVAFKDNGNYFKILYRGEVFELGVWNGTIDFQAGCDIVCFNDPTTRTFAVFDKGQFLDVEQFWIKKYKAGRGFIVYEDLGGNLMYYKDGEKHQLSNFGAGSWDVKDDIVYWTENTFAYALQNGKKIQLGNVIPKDYLIKNNVIAYRNVMGGVSALVDGEIVELTNQMDAEYEIFGNSVLVKLFNRSFIVYSDGKKYQT
ncbi:MAG: hypothetical protein EP305_01190 [Bacteroidetes bacterium]|nr:MAG: hypothetical protein EP305_01190 [Bacteroidota bacterium]